MISKRMVDYIEEMKEEFPDLDESTISAVIRQGCFEIHKNVTKNNLVHLFYPRIGLSVRFFNRRKRDDS